MSRLQTVVSVTIVVLATILVATAGYGGMAIQLRHTASVEQVPPSPAAKAPPTPLLESPAPPAQGSGGLSRVDEYMLDSSIGWMLESDCVPPTSSNCVFAVVKTTDGGSTWSAPARVGPPYATTDGDAPRSIHFLNIQDGFVYGQDGAFVTHDSGATWHEIGVNYGSVPSMAMAAGMVWLSVNECSKGTICESEALWSADGGRTWSGPHVLEPGLDPEVASAFTNGVLLSSPVQPMDSEMTTDRGLTWRTIKSPCPQPPYLRSSTTTTDGVELRAVCEPFPDGSGQTPPQALYVSADGGRTWSLRAS